MIEHRISLEMRKRTASVPPQVVVRVGDIGTQVVSARLTYVGEPYEPVDAKARLDILKADGTWCRAEASVSGDTVSCELPSQALSSPGMCRLAHFVFDDDGSVESTEGFDLRVLHNVDTSGEGAAYYDDALEKLMDAWRAWETSAKDEWAGQMDSQQEEFERAEEAREEAESGRVAAEQSRVEAEQARAAAESARVDAEDAREKAESARSGAEAARESSEGQRASAEQAREQAEQAREQAESARASAEQGRASAEQGRVSAESWRTSAEQQRAQSQAENDAAQAKNNADQSINNQKMQRLSPYICSEGEYDPDTLMPTVEGEEGRMYYVPNGMGPGNVYVEWMLVGGEWEMLGVSKVELTPISTDEVDAVAAGSAPSGESVLNLTGLSYLWAKLKSAFAALSHKHSAADVTSGTLSSDRLPTVPVSKGGTGATTVSAALSALGAAASSHTHAEATESSAGFMSASDKARLARMVPAYYVDDPETCEAPETPCILIDSADKTNVWMEV